MAIKGTLRRRPGLCCNLAAFVAQLVLWLDVEGSPLEFAPGLRLGVLLTVLALSAAAYVFGLVGAFRSEFRAVELLRLHFLKVPLTVACWLAYLAAAFYVALSVGGFSPGMF